MSKRRNNDEVNGNAVASAQAFTRQLIRLGELMHRFELMMERYDDEDVMLLSMRLVLPGVKRNDYMVVVNAQHGQERICCFQNGLTFVEALEGMLSRLENRSVKWQPDKFAS